MNRQGSTLDEPSSSNLHPVRSGSRVVHTVSSVAKVAEASIPLVKRGMTVGRTPRVRGSRKSALVWPDAGMLIIRQLPAV
jgi:hypothetical protein